MSGSSGILQGAGSAAVVAIAGCALLLLAASTWAEDSPDQRMTDALLEEGTLLYTQTAKLQPVAALLDKERKRLQAEEIQLTDEAAKVNKSFDEFNTVADELNAATKLQREDCSAGSSKFDSEVDSCNSRAETLRVQAARLLTQGAELDKRQQDVNQRIVQHNAAGREWNRRSKEHQEQWVPSVQEVQRWLGRFKDFFESETFSKFALTAGHPHDCSEDAIGALNPLDTLPSLTRALQCLKALKAGTSSR
jgi:hypothetical protein